jgi:hypothetical protein
MLSNILNQVLAKLHTNWWKESGKYSDIKSSVSEVLPVSLKDYIPTIIC